MSKIIHIATALPTNKHKQSDISLFMNALHNCDKDNARKLSLLYAKSGIENRYSVLSDFSSSSFSNDSFFTPLTIPGITSRLKLFEKYAPTLATEALNKCFALVDKASITHLITVSCTGMYAPGLDLELVNILNLNKNIHRTSVNFMGCYAALHALKQAYYITQANTNAVVAVVCVELCTLHFQHTFNWEQVAANMLFADGAAACIIAGTANKNKGLRIKSFYSEIKVDGKQDMTWHIAEQGFLMRLSSYIPQLLKDNCMSFFDDGLKAINLQNSDIDYWAIHPGGKKILENIQVQMSITPNKISNSYDVLKQHGNMSSATILFVLNDIMKNIKDNQKIAVAAFGPGLTLESMYLQYD